MTQYVCFWTLQAPTVVHSPTKPEPARFVKVCFPIVLPEVPSIPKAPPGPPPPPEWPGWGQIRALATIVDLTESLPNEAKMREELRGVATKALESAVAELGGGAHLSQSDQSEVFIGAD